MITLLHVIGEMNSFGGTPRKLLYLVRHLDARRCRQVFLCYQACPLKEELERYGALVECIDDTSPVKIFRHAIRLARTQHAAAVCTHFSRPLVAGYLAARAVDIPQIHHQHGSAGYIHGIGRTLTRWVLPRVNTVICNSDHTCESIRQEFNVPKERLFVLHNPVEPREPSAARGDFRRAMGLPDDALLIGHIGGMIPERDQATLVRAFACLQAQYPCSRLVLIGDGPMRRELESLAVSLGLASCVIFTGYAENVGDYLNAIDIYVNTTLDEGFGIAVAEAMLARLPVVLSDCGAHPELIENGVSGMLFPGRGVEPLTEILTRLAGDREMCRKLGESAFERAATRYHPKVYADGYYEHALKTINEYRTRLRGRPTG